MRATTLLPLPLAPIKVRSLSLQFILQGIRFPLSTPLNALRFYCDSLTRSSQIFSEKLSEILDEIDKSMLPQERLLSQLFQALLPFFEEIEEDENVLLYCLKHRESLNNILGTRAIEKLLSHLFPGGIECLRAHLKQRYEQRHFADYFAKYESLLDALIL